jgi:hypothetical protein
MDAEFRRKRRPTAEPPGTLHLSVRKREAPEELSTHASEDRRVAPFCGKVLLSPAAVWERRYALLRTDTRT